MARMGGIDPGVGRKIPLLVWLYSVLSDICLHAIAGIQNHLKNNGADFGEIRRREPRVGSKDA